MPRFALILGILSLTISGCSDKEMQATHKTLEVVHFILSLPAKERVAQEEDIIPNECNRAGSHTERLVIQLEILRRQKEIAQLQAMVK